MKIIREDIGDVLKPKSDEQINKDIADFTPAKLLKFAIRNDDAKRALMAIKNGANIQGHQYEALVKLLPDVNLMKYLDVDGLFKVGVETKDLSKIKSAIRKGAKNLDYLNGQALMVAIHAGDTGLVKALLKEINPRRGGRLENMYPHFDNAPIRKASQWGKTDIVKLLLKDWRVDPAVDDHWPLKVAIKNKKWGVVEALISDDRVLKKLSGKTLKAVLRKLTKMLNT